jgi:hypothetical protein
MLHRFTTDWTASYAVISVANVALSLTLDWRSLRPPCRSALRAVESGEGVDHRRGCGMAGVGDDQHWDFSQPDQF